MAPDDTDEHRVDDGDGTEDEPQNPLDEPAVEDVDAERDSDGDNDRVRNPTVEEVDQRIVDLLSWILDTETRAKIYVYLLANPGSTSEEVARGTGLYPSTVREALAELHEEDRVTREKRASEGAGNNPYEYTAIQPSDLVGGVVDQVQQELNTIFTLDRVLDREDADAVDAEPTFGDEVEPVTITVDETNGGSESRGSEDAAAESELESESEAVTDIEITETGDDADSDAASEAESESDSDSGTDVDVDVDADVESDEDDQ